ncbi:Hypothetical protein I595_387 [Croceitalea dokdonensis DOKDO 023]|uniref:Uncharacterized protein n=1 Tax=Croceitalea dokdonensis DOKDO 023 TaxID=1300341 RepID=A0A0N8H4I7_9FLAO|nr:Hypothetical protein I595_387 [Croceitalea dokdonensis DOKDO 023]
MDIKKGLHYKALFFVDKHYILKNNLIVIYCNWSKFHSGFE